MVLVQIVLLENTRQVQVYHQVIAIIVLQSTLHPQEVQAQVIVTSIVAQQESICREDRVKIVEMANTKQQLVQRCMGV